MATAKNKSNYGAAIRITAVLQTYTVPDVHRALGIVAGDVWPGWRGDPKHILNDEDPIT